MAIKTNARKLIALIAAAGIVAGATGAFAAGNNTANFDKRRDEMKVLGRGMGAVTRVVRGQAEHSPAVATAVEDMQKALVSLHGSFEAGSDTADSKMKPEALANKAEIDQLLNNLQDVVAKQLLPAAQSGNKEAMGAALTAAGGACGACHTKYRMPQS